MSILMLIAAFFLVACGGSGSGSNDNNSSVKAPASLNGRIFNITIHSGTGFFASKGSYIIDFFELDSRQVYKITGDGTNVVETEGFYTYSVSDNTGRISIEDSSLGQGVIYYTFTSSTGGTYVASNTDIKNSNPTSIQRGVFEELFSH